MEELQRNMAAFDAWVNDPATPDDDIVGVSSDGRRSITVADLRQQQQRETWSLDSGEAIRVAVNGAED